MSFLLLSSHRFPKHIERFQLSFPFRVKKHFTHSFVSQTQAYSCSTQFPDRPSLDYGKSYLPSHRSCDLQPQHIGEKISLLGWIESIRHHAHQLTFLPIRDGYGKTQAIVRPPYHAALCSKLKDLTIESAVFVEGTLVERPNKSKKNPSDFELEVHSLELLNKAEPLPFSLVSQPLPNEETRLKYRYLDLRRTELQHRIRFRSHALQWMRTWLHAHAFVEVDTPLLFKSTPEGAREFLVPSRTPGRFYALPQSPQQWKQLLMVGGVARYFQMAKCFRDEDQRRDRQPEFTQLDLEVAGANLENLMGTVEALVFAWFEACLHTDLAQWYPNRVFPRLSFAEAMRNHGSDRPDLRSDTRPYAFVWVTHFPLFTAEPNLVATHHPFTAPMDPRVLETDPLRATGMHFDLVLNGNEIGGGSMRIHQRVLQEKVFDLLGIDKKPFHHWLTAMQYGCPPHGGLALGLDRLLSLVLNTASIRDVIAFPKSNGVDLMVESPSEVTSSVLSEYSIQVRPPAEHCEPAVKV